MTTPTEKPRKATARDLFFFANPEHWPTWPVLPVVRRHDDGEMQCGLLYDIMHLSGRTGFSSTVFLCNIFLMPQNEDEFLALPKEVFDSPEEMAAAGWCVD
ncbi:MAG TPA: hypothetical protein VH592_12675 [Gemmataceae bacterium]